MFIVHSAKHFTYSFLRLILIWAAVITPLCWFGSPHDFWFVAPAALGATAVACIMIMVKESLDVRDEESCYADTINSTITNTTDTIDFEPSFPDKITFLGFGEGKFIVNSCCLNKKPIILAFSLIMFAYAGSASFPTYQADMEKKSDFPKAVVLAMACKFIALLV